MAIDEYPRLMEKEITVGSISRRDVLECFPQTSIKEAARKMRDFHCGSIIVVEDGKPIGIWTESDALRTGFGDVQNLDAPISEVMSSPLKTIHSETLLEKAGLLFNRYGFRHLLVVDDADRAFGIVSQTDIILHSQAEHFFLLSNVGSIMEHSSKSVSGDTPFRVVMEKMSEDKTEVVFVEAYEDDEPGVITQRDVINIIAQDKLSCTATEVASRPLISVPHDTSLTAARDFMKSKSIRHLAITGEDGELTGILSFSDFLRGIQYNYFQRLEENLERRTKRLRESEERFRNLVEQTSDWVWEINSDFIYTYVNPKVFDILGYEPDEILGRPLFEFMPPEEAIQVAGVLQAIAKLNNPFSNFKNTNVHKSGQRVVLETSGVPTFSKDKEFLGYRGISRNITERMRVEEARHKLETLTPREQNVLQLVVNGKTNKGIARELGISDKTVELHRSRVMSKMEAGTLADLVKITVSAKEELQ